MADDADLTLLLDQAARGDAAAGARFFRATYDELRRMAQRQLHGEHGGHLLQATALVNEAWLRLWPGQPSWDNRRHFFGAAARSMRQVLIDQARRRDAAKRGAGADHVSLAGVDEAQGDSDVDLLQLDRLLDRLEALNPRFPRLVELRVFAGLGVPECADLLDVSPATVKRDWAFVRSWLQDALDGGA